MKWLSKLSFLLVSCLLLLFAACGSLPSATTTSNAANTNATDLHANKTTSTSSSVTTNNSALQTNCPAAGKVRVAVMASLSKGTHPTVIYTLNNVSSSDQKSFIRRFDTVTKTTTNIAQFSHLYIRNAQVSTDGQWVLFIAEDSAARQSKLELVRIDGQGMQTLYCQSTNSSMQYPQWSIDQHKIAFSGTIVPSGSDMNIFVLDIQHGTFERAVSNLPNITDVATWLDDNRLFLIGSPAQSPAFEDLYLLDLRKGANQQPKNLELFNKSQGCWSFDTSLDSTKVYIDEYTCDLGTATQPGVVSIPVDKGIAFGVYTGPLVVSTVRAIPNSELLMLASAKATLGGPQQLWKIKTDGTGLTNLINLHNSYSVMLNQNTQYYWANSSRDGNMFIATIVDATGQAPSFSLQYYSIGGKLLGTIAKSGMSQTSSPLQMAGWTTM